MRYSAECPPHGNSSYVFLMITGSLRRRPQVRCHFHYTNCQHHLARARHSDYPAEGVFARVTVKLLFLLPFHTELFGRSHGARTTRRRGQFSSSPLRRKHLHEPSEILLHLFVTVRAGAYSVLRALRQHSCTLLYNHYAVVTDCANQLWPMKALSAGSSVPLTSPLPFTLRGFVGFLILP